VETAIFIKKRCLYETKEKLMKNQGSVKAQKSIHALKKIEREKNILSTLFLLRGDR
jgi:hypothetical protein